MEVFIIGSGVVGQATGMGLVSKGHGATFYDIDPLKLERLEQAHCRTAHDVSEVERSDAVAVCVPTPAKDRTLDDSHVKSAVKSVTPFIHDQLILVRSTLVPGTMKELSSLVPSDNLAYNPEFLREATAFEDFLKPDRVIIGAESKAAALKAKELYSWYGGPILRMGWEEAEMVKLVSNAFLCTRISFFNEVYLMCKNRGLDPDVVSQAVALDRRVGTYGTKGGRAFDGKCLPKDIAALSSFTVTNPSVVMTAMNFNIKHMG